MYGSLQRVGYEGRSGGRDGLRREETRKRWRTAYPTPSSLRRRRASFCDEKRERTPQEHEVVGHSKSVLRNRSTTTHYVIVYTVSNRRAMFDYFKTREWLIIIARLEGEWRFNFFFFFFLAFFKDVIFFLSRCFEWKNICTLFILILTTFVARIVQA